MTSFLTFNLHHTGKIANQTATAIRAWTFLFITIPSCDLGGSHLIENALHVMHQQLFGSETAVRLSAGEAITVIFVCCNLGSLRLAGEISQGTPDSGLEAVLLRMKEIEKNLGDESRKSKKDRSEQRSEFREFLKIIDVRCTKQCTSYCISPSYNFLEHRYYAGRKSQGKEN